MCQLSYAYAIARQGQLDQALAILESIYTSRSKLFGPENAMVLMAQVALAEVQRKLGSLEPAESNLSEAYEARMRVWGITPFASIDTVIHLIIVCREAGKPNQAQEYVDILSWPHILEPFFERFCQVSHLRALLLIDAGKQEQGRAILSSLMDLSLQKGRESNNRSLLWVRLTLATILRQGGKDDEASELFEDLVTTSGGDDSDSVHSLDGEPQPPRVLEIAEKALRLVRDRKQRQAELLLDENGLKWKRVRDFWIPSGGPAADTGWMSGP
jgi:tetratricopeptide (TPR) repeat protein